MRCRSRPSILALAVVGVLAALSPACSSLPVSTDQPIPITLTTVATPTATVLAPTSTPTPAPTPTPDHRYAFIDESMTWTEAQSYCEKQGAHLATITSVEEQQVVASLLLSIGTKKNYWLGGTKENGQWKWITGEGFPYTHWASGEPSNGNGEDVLSIVGKDNGGFPTPGLWDDCYNEGYTGEFALINYGLVCEWGR